MLELLMQFLAQPFLIRSDIHDRMSAMLPVLLKRAQTEGGGDIAGGLKALQLRVDPINPTTMVGSVAVIDVVGPLSKQPGIYRWFGIDQSATLPEIERAVKTAVADSKVSAILMRVDSPGGTVAGTEAVGDAIFEARKVKPVWTQAQDCACSAGYWIGSQAEKMFANRSADLANIGVVGALYDFSKLFEEFGIKAVVARSTPLKGIGVMGDEINEAQQAELARWVKSTHGIFVDTVARGRRMDTATAAKLADARVLNGDAALAVGLIDGVRGIDETLNELAQATAPGVGSGASGLTFTASTVAAGLHGDGAQAMDKQLRAFLESIGLAANAGLEDAKIFWRGLEGENKAKADALALAASGGGSEGSSAGEGQQGSTGDGGQAGAGQASSDAGGDGGSQTPANAQTPAPVVGGPTRSQIQEFGRMGGMSGDTLNQFTALHTLKGSDEATVRAEAATFLEAQMPPIGRNVTTAGDDGRESLVAALGDVIAMNMDVEIASPHPRAATIQHMTMVELGRQWLSSLGVANAHTMDRYEVAEAMIDPFKLSAVVGSVALGHGTSDFGGVLGASANKSLIQAFAQEEVTYDAWAKHEDLPNMLQHEEFTMGGVPRPSKVLEGAEYGLVTFGEKGEFKQVAKYGLRVVLTIEMIINDTLNAFNERVMDFGGSARALRNQLVYEKLTGNAVLNEDSKTVFHADHNNLNQGGAAAPSAATLKVMKKSMRLQKGVVPDAGQTGRNLAIRPAFLIGPEEHADDFDLLVSSRVKIGGTNDEPNLKFLRNLIPITDPELSDDSASAYYLTGPKRKAPVKSLGLKGFTRPTVTKKSVSATDGLEYKLRDFAGAANTDYRSVQKNDGA